MTSHTTKVKMGMIDHSGELTSFNFHLDELTNTNFDELFLAATGKYDLLKVVTIPLTILNLTRSTMSKEIDQSVGSLPSDEHAQRELALRIFYADSVEGTKYRLDIPGPAAAAIPQGTDIVPLTNVPLAAWIVVFEAECVTPEGNAPVVTGARIVGRRN